MVYRGRGNPRGRGFSRPPRSRGRGRRPFPHRGQMRGGFGRGDEGLRITLRNTGRDRHDDRPPLDRESNRRDSYDSYRDDFDQERGNDFEQESRFQGDQRETSRREPGMAPPRKRQHSDSDFMEDESLRITVGNDMYEEEFSNRRESPHTSNWESKGRQRGDRWADERREDQSHDNREDRRRNRDDRRSDSYDGGRGKWEDDRPSGSSRGRGRGHFRGEYDPNYRGRGRGGYRGRGQGSYDPSERGRGWGHFKHFGRGRDRGDHHPHDRHSLDNDFNRSGQGRFGYEGRRSRSRDRYSRSPGRRRSRSRSFGRRRSSSRDSRSYSRDRRSRSRGRRSRSRGKQSRSPRRRSYSRGRPGGSHHRYSPSRSRSFSGSRGSSSRSYSQERSPDRSYSQSPRRIGRPGGQQSMGRESPGLLVDRDDHHRSRRRSLSSSSSSSPTNSRSHGSPSEMSEQQYEQEMYQRLKTEISSNKDPKEREECIAKHIREMAKLSPLLFRQFMAKNASNLSAMAMMQPDQEQDVEVAHSQDAGYPHDSKPLRSILKRKDSRSPSVDRNPSPPREQPKALSQIEKVIQALRKGGTRQEELKRESEKSEKDSTPPRTGALRQISAYMDIDEEEEFLYGGGPKERGVEADNAARAGPFWAANRFEEGQQPAVHGVYEAEPQTQTEPVTSSVSQTFGRFGDHASAKEGVKLPPSFSTFEEKEKSYEQWRASVFQKPMPEKVRESPPAPPATVKDSESAEPLNSTVENILKSIGFNFELSQRMQELARQKKEGEQEAIKINQSASFLGPDSDTLAEDLTSVFQSEGMASEPHVDEFIRQVEASTKAAREKALRAKGKEEMYHRKKFSEEIDHVRERDRDYSSHRDSGCFREESEKRSRKDSVPARSQFGVPSGVNHPPYDPSVQDYHHDSYQTEQQYGISDLHQHQRTGSYFEDQPKPIRTSNLISLSGDSREHEDSHGPGGRKTDASLTDFDKNIGDFSYKKTGERILIVKKRDSRNDSPGADSSSFSRRIVLPPKEKSKVSRGRSPEPDSWREGKRRGPSPDSPRLSKISRRSPSIEDFSIDKRLFQKSKSSRETDSMKADSYGQERERSLSLENAKFDSGYKYRSSLEGSKKDDPKTKSEPLNSRDLLRAKLTEAFPKPESKKESSSFKGGNTAARQAEDNLQMVDRTQKLAALERELTALQKQHNELLRKCRRQREGHKDPLIAENVKLQLEIASQMKILRESGDVSVSESASLEKSKPLVAESSSSKKVSMNKSKEKETSKISYEYFDPGSHWCSSCNVVCGHMFDFLKHIDSKKHQQKLDPFNRPWLMEAMKKQEKKPKPQGPVQAAPIKGLEFMMATAAFYCSLCSEFCGDLSIAETHMKSEEHHEKYKNYLSQHPYYEKRHMLERSAALSTQKTLSSEDIANDSNSQHSDDTKTKTAIKSESDRKNSSKDEGWRDKVSENKSLYADQEEAFKKKSDSRDKHRHRDRSRSRERYGRSHRDSRDRKGSKDRDGRSKRGDSRDGDNDDKDGRSKASTKKPASASKTTKSSQKPDDTVDPSNMEGEKQSNQNSTKEETQQAEEGLEEETSMKAEGREDEAKKDREIKKEGDIKKEGEAEVKGKIPIKLTGKSGIKPVSTLPPWKALTRAIPKSTTQRRLLTGRPQAAAAKPSTVLGPALPNEDPVPLEDFLTVGVQKSVPILPEVTHIPIPPDPKFVKKEEESTERSQEELEEMQMLGIDPQSLVPNVMPKAPPPPSQNLSLPGDKAAVTAVADLSLEGRTEDSPKEVEKENLPSGDSGSFLEGTSSSDGGAQWKPETKTTDPDTDSNSNQESKTDHAEQSVLAAGEEGMSALIPVPSQLPPCGVSVTEPAPVPSQSHGLPQPSATSCQSILVSSATTQSPDNAPLFPSVCIPSTDFTAPAPGTALSLGTMSVSPTTVPVSSHPLSVPLPQEPLTVPDTVTQSLGFAVPQLDASISVSNVSSSQPGAPPLPEAVASVPIFSAPPEVSTSQPELSVPNTAMQSASYAPLQTGVSNSSECDFIVPQSGASSPRAIVSSLGPAPEPVFAVPCEAAPLQQEPVPKPDTAETTSGYIPLPSDVGVLSSNITAPLEGVPSEPETMLSVSPSMSHAVPSFAAAPVVSSPQQEPHSPGQQASLPSVAGTVEDPGASVPEPLCVPMQRSDHVNQPGTSSGAEAMETEGLLEAVDANTPSQSEVAGTSLFKDAQSTSALVSSTQVPSVIPLGTASAQSVVTTTTSITGTSENIASSSAPVPSPVPESSHAMDHQLFASGSVAEQSSDFAEPTSSLVSASPGKRGTARRGRGGRKTSPVPSASEEELAVPEASGVSSAAAASRRPRTRSQARPQPQRQTRSRTRQQKTEDEEENVTASDEGSLSKSVEEVGSSTAQEAESAPLEAESVVQEMESGDGNKASSTSGCVLDLTNPPADSSGGSESNTEVTSSSNAVKACTLVESPPSGDSALNLTVPPEVRESRQGRVEQTMPEDLSSYAQPQDLSTSSSSKAGRRPPEMPIDLTMRLAPSQSVGSSMSEVSQPMEVEPSPCCQISSSESMARADSVQTVKDTLLSSTSAMNPSASSLSELEVGDEGGTMEDDPSQSVDSAGLGVDPEGELVDFSLAPVDFEELVDMEVEDSGAAPPEAAAAEESEGTADSTLTPE